MARLKIPASSILESTIAMTIMAIVFTLSFMSFDQLLNTNKSIIQLRSSIAFQEIIQRTIKEQHFFDEIIKKKGFYIQKTILESTQNNSLYEVQLRAFSNNKHLIQEQKQLIYIP